MMPVQPPDPFWYTVKSIALVGAIGTFMYLLGKKAGKSRGS